MQCSNNFPGDWIIAESDNYYIKGAYESAELFSKADDKLIACIGDHYGDTVDGIIDRNERFCVTVGCGYIVYYIREPFESYPCNRSSTQWIESGNDPDNIKGIDNVRQISDNEIELTDENGNIETVTIPI